MCCWRTAYRSSVTGRSGCESSWKEHRTVARARRRRGGSALRPAERVERCDVSFAGDVDLSLASLRPMETDRLARRAEDVLDIGGYLREAIAWPCQPRRPVF